jgi:hypothetical protein
MTREEIIARMGEPGEIEDGAILVYDGIRFMMGRSGLSEAIDLVPA